MKKQTGLTLIELIIVVSIVGIMAAYAVPNFGGLMRSSQLKTSYNDFVGVISTARAEAVNNSTTITVCVSTDGDPRGRLRTEGSFVFCDGENDATARALNLWVTGLGRLATDTNDNGTVETADGNEVSCSL